MSFSLVNTDATYSFRISPISSASKHRFPPLSSNGLTLYEIIYHVSHISGWEAIGEDSYGYVLHTFGKGQPN